LEHYLQSETSRTNPAGPELTSFESNRAYHSILRSAYSVLRDLAVEPSPCGDSRAPGKHMDTVSSVIILTATYAVLFVLERAFPLRRPTARLLQRVRVNVAISLAAFATAAVLVRPGALAALDFAGAHSLGLIKLAGLEGPAEWIVSFVLLDLTFYYWHRANHRWWFLWRFHNVHHIDPDLDVTTGFRFHFVEVALSAAFRIAQLLVIGPSLAAFAIYEVAFQSFTLFHHSNLRLPCRVDAALNRVIVTPRMHGIHHSDFRDETNSNFGIVFRWWDGLHGTLRLDVPQAEIDIGIPAYSAPRDNRLLACLVLPVVRQRDYWRSTNGLRLTR
jgi:sterol desaturase/sphingolipid hydroxylase (fatty acid hydroxylase superfamily)